jgi:hypothetical protein
MNRDANYTGYHTGITPNEQVSQLAKDGNKLNAVVGGGYFLCI